ncbi:Clp protease regulatory subunit ClpX2, mitochondrial-like protein [Tanacetum coccineum]
MCQEEGMDQRRGCVFEDVKFTNMVGLGKLPLDLKEIVKSVTHGASIKTKKSERKARAQVTPTETDGVAITEVEMGDTSSLTEKVVRNAEAKEAQLSNLKCLGEITHIIKYITILIDALFNPSLFYLIRQDLSIGFGAPVRTNMRVVGLTNVVVASSLLETLESGDLVAYGLIPKFIGRFPILVSSSALNEDQLLQVCDQCEATVYRYCTKIDCEKAIAKNTGAKGLRVILENVLVDSKFEVFYTSVLSSLRYFKIHSLKDDASSAMPFLHKQHDFCHLADT